MSKQIILTRKSIAAVLFTLIFTATGLFFTDILTARAERTGFNAPPENSFANLNLVITVAQDGIATMNAVGDTLNTRNICPANPTDGCDFSQNDGVVRTNDSVVYVYDYSVNGGNEDITITATAPLGTTWNFLPAFCLSGSTLNSGNGTTTASIITCKRGVQAQGTTESLPFTATVLGTVTNGTVINATGTVSGPGSASVNATAPNVTVTAAPRFNLRITYQTYSPYTHNTVAGYRIEYRAYIEMYDDSNPSALNTRLGSAILSSPITFTDNVSQISSNAQLVSCVKQSDNGGAGGTIACSQTSAGQNVSATVTGADSSLRQYTSVPNGNRYIVGTYQIFIFIPTTDITNAPGASLSTTNTLTDFEPTSTTGQSNFGASTEMASDNSVSRSFTIPTGSFSKLFVRDYNNSSSSVGSSGLVAPGEIFATQLSFTNNTGAVLNNFVQCDVMDNAKYSVIETSPGSGLVHQSDGATPTAVEFATGYVNANWLPTGSGGNPSGIRAECNDPGVVWYSSPTAVPGGLAAITKFRARYNSLADGANPRVRVRVQARDTNFYNGQTIFNGTVLPNFGIWRSDELNPNYVSNDYYQGVFPGNSSGNSSLGSRVILSRAIARITKETESNNTVNSVTTGGTIGYVLKPTLTTSTNPTPVQVTVLDVLPAGLTYLTGTGQQSGSSFEPQIISCTGSGAPISQCPAAGRQVLRWTLNNQMPNAAISPISFRALADLTIQNNQTITNTAIVSTPADPSAESTRTATRNVTAGVPLTLLVFKNTATPQIEVNSPFNYTVSYRNSSVNTTFTNLDFIDVLPFNGDTTLNFDTGTHERTPPSAFNGTRTVTSLSATTASPTWYFTNAAPASINISAKHSSNLSPGTGGSIWCAGTATGPNAGCGFTLAQATAVRLIDNTAMPTGTAVRSFTLNFSSSGNQANDRYTNNSSGSAAELVLAVSSNNVPVVVLESSMSGSVWFDTNGDGVRGGAETGRASGITVTLTGTSSGGSSVNRTTTTAANGTYAFTQLPSGNYTVQFSRPTNYQASPQDIGGDDTLDSDGDISTLTTSTISLGVNDSKTNIDQGFYQLNLGGTVWRDANSNGTMDGGERLIANENLSLLDGNDVVIRTTQTNGSGNYLFTDLPAGNYRVRIDTVGVTNSPVSNANPNDDIDGDNNGVTQMGVIISNQITLAPGAEPTLTHADGTTVNTTLDFGVSASPTAAQLTLGGRVLTQSGRGIGGAMLTMYDANGNVRYARTNPFGYYRFTQITANSTVVITVSAKNNTFTPNGRAIMVTDEFTEVNFVGDN